mmetsp:Transcript_67208/g.133185  ORF Transcript_67208/g.133185 Transcript_67208/m.133185 type:complete len:573 (-) Transcript_67208:221-1939(-)
MGKKQHSKDQLYLTNTEHASGEHRGKGKQSLLHLPYKTLPFDCCAISFRPFETPLCTADGIVFELLNIVPFLKKYRRHPVTGAPLAASDLIKLHFHKNSDGQYACPVLFKPFTQFTHIVAIKPTGNVYCHDAVKQMNLKTGHLHDLLDETPFKREDVIHIQDPSNGNRREIERFTHVGEGLQLNVKDDSGVRHNDATKRIMEQVAVTSGKADTAVAGGKAKAKASAPGSAAGSGSGGGGGSSASVPVARWTQTTGKAAASLTSTAVPVQTINEIAPLSEEESARQRYAFVRKLKTKGYVQLTTSLGTINIELHVDICPRTCENFLLLLERNYYDGTVFHRVIRNFMVQGGDPTGTGTGGDSAWGGAFNDEISNKLKHDGRGILAMANSGPNTNRSQFYITFKSAAHLDGKHAVFGRVVGGLDTLAKLEALKTDKEDRPTTEVSLLSTNVIVNPFADIEAKMQVAAAKAAHPEIAIAEEKARAAEMDGQAWFNNQAAPQLKVQRPGIGKYIASHHLPQEAQMGVAGAAGSAVGAVAASATSAAAFERSAAVAAQEPPKKKAKGYGGFGSFDGW